jgi:putative phage-type endonuclease
MTIPRWPAPAGCVEILPAAAQRVDEGAWLAARQAGLGGSDVSAVLGLNPWKSAYEVWLDKTGQLPPTRSTYAMERGHRLESACAQWFCDQSGLSARRTGTWVRLDEPWMRANPDRWVSDGGGYEGKTTGEDWGNAWAHGETPAQHAALQSMWCMAVTGLGHWYVAALADSWFRWWRLPRDEALIGEMVDRCGTWWKRYVEADRPPPVDGSEATSKALKRAYARPEPVWRDYRGPMPLSDMAEVPGLTLLREERRDLKVEVAEREARIKKLENEIRARLGHCRVGLEDGLPVMGWPLKSRRAPHSEERITYRQLEEYR